MTEVVKLSHRLHTLGSLGFREQHRPIRKLKSSRTAELCRVGMVLAGGETPGSSVRCDVSVNNRLPRRKRSLVDNSSHTWKNLEAL